MEKNKQHRIKETYESHAEQQGMLEPECQTNPSPEDKKPLKSEEIRYENADTIYE